MRLAALLVVTTLASPAANDHAIELLRVWLTAVDEHLPGEHDAAMDRVGAWGQDEVEMMLDYVQAFAGLPTNTTDRARRRTHVYAEDQRTIGRLSTQLKQRGDFDRFLKRAALLHSDLAMFGSSAVRVNQPPAGAQRPRNQPTRRIDVLSSDGQVQQFQLANPHWEYARDLLEALPKKPRVDPIVAQWYRAIAAHFMLHRSFAEALDHFEAARRIVPDAPEALYGEACLQEIFGAPRIQDYVRIANRQGIAIRDIGSPQSHFRKTADLLRRALAIEPVFVDARLRLGHALIELKQYDEALVQLQQVVTGTKDPALLYYAHIFSGDASMALQRPPEARAAYALALELYPKAQAARLGLATALRLMGDRSGAVNAVTATIGFANDNRDEHDEPWWNYYDGDAAVVDLLLTDLRRPYLKQ